MASRYPTRDEILDIFKIATPHNFAEIFLEHVDPNVDWTVLGTHPLAGRFNSRDEFVSQPLARFRKVMKEPGIGITIHNVIGGGDQEWAVFELIAKAECLNGTSFQVTNSERLSF